MIKQLSLRMSGNNDILLQTLQLHTFSVASFPCTLRLAFCCLPFSKQLKPMWQPEEEILSLHLFTLQLHSSVKKMQLRMGLCVFIFTFIS